MSSLSEEFLVSRQKAAKILGVSTRTVDRYIAQEKFSIIREDGKVFLDSRELTHYKNGKNPVVAHMVNNSSSSTSPDTVSVREFSKSVSSPENSDILRYKFLYEESKSEIEKRDELLRGMHYKLGILETEAKGTIPLLQAQNDQDKLEEDILKLSSENEELRQSLHSTRNARVFFFVLSLLFLLLILAIFVIQKGNLFQVS